jgi:maltose-binding protein MalE
VRFIVNAKRAVTRPQIPLYPQVSRQLQSMLEAVLTGRLAPAQAAAPAAELIEAITGLPIVHERARKRPAAAIDTAA